MKLGFFPRLLLAFLIVICVAGAFFYLVANALGPTLLQGHLAMMGITHHNVPPGTSTMLTDLEIAYRRALAQSIFWAFIATLLVGGGLSFFIARQITSPLEHMRRAARRIAAGEYKERVTYTGPAEMTELASDFNTMAAGLEYVERQRSELIRNLAHEARTPLMNLRGYIEALEDGVFSLTEETLGATKRQLTRLERLMTDLSLLSRVEARQEGVKLERVQIMPVVNFTCTALKPQFDTKKVELILEPWESEVWVMADPIRTEQVLTNLLTNALRHTPAEGQVHVWLSHEDRFLKLHVKDTGDGIPQKDLAHIFERFYRGSSRDDNTGSGIGLTIAEYFVKAQGGTIGVDSHKGQGSHFWFSLPLA